MSRARDVRECKENGIIWGQASENPDLSIVIPVWNNWYLTKACLQDLYLKGDFEIILVDNGSTDETKNYGHTEKIGRVQVIRNKENLGFAKACNQGFAASRGKVVMFLNNDIKVVRNKALWTVPIIEACNEGCIVGPTVGVLKKDLSFVKEAEKKPSGGHYYMSGWNISAKREVWKKLILEGEEGPFTTEFTTYFEDTDLGLRAQELGIPTKIVSVPVRHLGKRTSKLLGVNTLYVAAKEKFMNKWGGGRADKLL